MNFADNTSLYRRISLHVAPPLVVLYFVAFLDRVNVSFAALTMNKALGISNTLYGLAAGIFFLGYMLLAIPSNLALQRFGARRWIAVLMIVWGILSGCMAFVHGPKTYILLRFLVGAAEAGFFPGVILYLTQWLPGSARAGIMGLFMFSVPLSSVIGAPVSAWILKMHGARGLDGWQWLFLLEALPAILLGCIVPWLLTSSPQEARWLSEAETSQLLLAMQQEVAASDAAREPSARFPINKALAASLTYFFYAIGLYTLGFWVPKLLSSHGVALGQLGWLTAVPFAIGSAGMFVWTRHSDRINERRRSLACAFTVAAIGMAIAAMAPTVSIVLAGLSIVAIGTFAALPIFWAGFSQRILPQHAAVAIALVNSLGNIGGFLGPYATGWLLDRTHTYTVGLLCTAACLLLGGLLALIQGKTKRV